MVQEDVLEEPPMKKVNSLHVSRLAIVVVSIISISIWKEDLNLEENGSKFWVMLVLGLISWVLGHICSSENPEQTSKVISSYVVD